MMAAIAAASNPEHRVFLLEQNEKLGKKLYITGKGRGNFTNAADMDRFLEETITNPRFLYAAFYQFSNQDLLAFLEENRLKWKEERGGRIFPVSDHASDITKALEKALRKAGVKIRLQTKVTEPVMESPKKVCGVRLSSGEVMPAEAVVIATGGLSYKTTGSTGDGLRMAEALGLAVKEPCPALVPLEVADKELLSLQGLSLKNVSFCLSAQRKKCFEGFGEILFTHFGISGPIVLSVSSVLARRLHQGEAFSAAIDFKPAVEAATLDARLQRLIQTHHKKSAAHFFDELMPAKIRPLLVERAQMEPAQRIGDITKVQRQRILELLKCFLFTVKGSRGFSEAIITQGGVSVKEIQPSTMRSKRIEGLSFAGEVLDVDALTGGYNLQIAFSTGYLAGRNA